MKRNVLCLMYVDSDISSPDWKPWDDMDDDDSIDVSQFQDKMESQQHEKMKVSNLLILLSGFF